MTTFQIPIHYVREYVTYTLTNHQRRALLQFGGGFRIDGRSQTALINKGLLRKQYYPDKIELTHDGKILRNMVIEDLIP